MGARAENGPDGFVRAVGGESWGCHTPGTGRAEGIRVAGAALKTLGLSTMHPLFSCDSIDLFVAVVTVSLAGGGINDNGGKTKGFNSRFGMGIENCSLMFRTLAIWASI
jgi:hypothetical protein